MKAKIGVFQGLEKSAVIFPMFGKFGAVAAALLFAMPLAAAAGPADDAEAAQAYKSASEMSDSALKSGDQTAFKNAIHLAKRATELAPTVPDYWQLLGRLSARAADQPELAEEAEAALRNGIALNPGSAGGHVALGSFYFLQNRYSEALQEFEVAVYISPELITPPVIAAMCRAYSEKKEWARAEKYFRSVVREFPDADIARLALAVVYKEEGKSDEAESEMRRVIVRSDAPESNAQCAWEIVNNWEKASLSK